MKHFVIVAFAIFGVVIGLEQPADPNQNKEYKDLIRAARSSGSSESGSHHHGHHHHHAEHLAVPGLGVGLPHLAVLHAAVPHHQHHKHHGGSNVGGGHVMASWHGHGGSGSSSSSSSSSSSESDEGKDEYEVCVCNDLPQWHDTTDDTTTTAATTAPYATTTARIVSNPWWYYQQGTTVPPWWYYQQGTTTTPWWDTTTIAVAGRRKRRFQQQLNAARLGFRRRGSSQCICPWGAAAAPS